MTAPAPDIEPIVTIHSVPARASVGVDFTVTVDLNAGTTYEHIDEGSTGGIWNPVPKTFYRELEVRADDGSSRVYRDNRPGGLQSGVRALSVGTPGIHTLIATGTTPIGPFVSAPVSIQVGAEAPPDFTVDAPVAGSVVDLGEAGAPVTVAVTVTTPNPFFPYTASIHCDGVLVVSEQFSSGQYQTQVTLPGMPLGQRTIDVTVADRDGQSRTFTVAVDGRDAAPPHLQVTAPKEGVSLVGDTDAAAAIHLVCTALDTQTGMASGAATVEWALSPTGPRTPAHPVTAGDFTNWAADIQLPGRPDGDFGPRTIYLWATDQAGNTTPEPERFSVNVISEYLPESLGERLNERAYLAALLAFTSDQVTDTVGGQNVDTDILVDMLGQPLGRLSQPLSIAADRSAQPVNELRIPMELLRAHIEKANVSTLPGAAGEFDYREIAYRHLLTAYGTSYEELRLARGADPADRQALAARLGIGLSSTPGRDELDQLTIDGDDLTEETLETLFGLEASTRDPLLTVTLPQICTWQLIRLASMWAEEDRNPQQRAFAVLVDPDVIAASAAAPGPGGDRVRTLLTQRATQLADFAARLETLRSNNSGDPQAALAAMVNETLSPVDLAELQRQDQRDSDISAILTAIGLTRAGFLRLRQLDRLAGADSHTVTPAEWADAIAVLTNAFKHQQYPTWQTEETDVVLSPDIFVLTDDAPEVNPYRADSRARSAWRDVLRGRKAQRQDLIEANAQAVAAAEQAALPILRNALLADVAATVSGDVGEAMSARFFVDMLAGGTVRTTRIQQAVASLQLLLIAMHSGAVPAAHPATDWALKSITEFTEAWKWLAELGSWQAATTAFLFPERHLDPALLRRPPTMTGVGGGGSGASVALDEFYQNLSSPGALSAFQAFTESTAYAAHLTVSLPDGGYLNPGRTAEHQTLVRDAINAAIPAGDGRREAAWAVPILLAQRLQAAGDFPSALDWYWIVYPFDVDPSDTNRPKSIFDTINTETSRPPNLAFPPGWTAQLDPFQLVAARPTAPYTRYTLLGIIRCHLDYADAEFGRETDASIAHARTLYVAARRLLTSEALQAQKPSNAGEPTLAIPDLDALKFRAEVQLTKLRQGRNIAGMPRTQPFGTVTVRQPTPYRFTTLMQRATQLAAQAAQIEAGYLAALEKYDEKNLRLHDAANAIELNAAQVTLAKSRTQQAIDSLTAAQDQQTKAGVMVQTYTTAINTPPNTYEQQLLEQYDEMRDIRDAITMTDACLGVAQAAAHAGGLVETATSFGANLAIAGGIAVLNLARGAQQTIANQLEADMQANQLQAGVEQRRAQWRMERAAAEQDAVVAAAQVTVASDQKEIAEQEQGIASLQHTQALATLRFLNAQFTNPDLYQWMSTTLGGVYRFFLQQATATARLAQAQLAFERAEQPQAVIRDDYWEQPRTQPANTGQPGSTGQPDRRGLTGAEQLSADLARLDDYAFKAGRRKLNLSQTFSLARLMPMEFLDFRRTGTVAFATPMALFDADFPGHYLRTIRDVNVSCAALIPPDRGIRAELICNGISRVTTADSDGRFQDIVLRHDPAMVALTSPVSASGVFDLDPHPDMLLPFEGSGVDTTWELRLPPAANPFDFSTIADVLITIGYTALADNVYRTQTITRLNTHRDRGADCVFSLARDFPDQWYELNNPSGPADRSVTLTLRDIDFPRGIENVTTGAIAVRLASSAAVPATAVSLRRGTTGGAGTTTDGIASTRRGNAPSWIDLCHTDPAGQWQLSFSPTAASLFDSGGLDDILMVISWTGQAPVWQP